MSNLPPHLQAAKARAGASPSPSPVNHSTSASSSIEGEMLTLDNLPGRNQFILSMGELSTLKTTFALTGPETVALFSFDHGEASALRHILSANPNKKIKRFLMDRIVPVKGEKRAVVMDQSHCQEVLDRFKRAWENVLSDPTVKTVVVDAGSQLEKILVGAIAGKLNQQSNEQRGKIEREMHALLSIATRDMGCSATVFWIHHMKERWVEKGVDRDTGKVNWSKVEGEWEEDGRREPAQYADVILRHFRELTPDGPEFSVRVMGKCRDNIRILGTDVCAGQPEDCTYDGLMRAIYP